MENWSLIKTLSPLSDLDYTFENLCGSMVEGVSGDYQLKYPLEIKNQLDTMACVGFSTSYALEIGFGVTSPLSQWWVYHNRDLTSGEDNPFPGYHIRNALVHCTNEGVVSLEDYNNPQECPDGILTLQKVKPELIGKATPYKIKSFVRLNSVEELNAFIRTYKCPALVAIAVYESVANTASDGILPECAGKLEGYHAMCITGNKGDLLVAPNSIGEEQGDHGYFYLNPNDPKLIQEMWGVIIEDSKAIVINKPQSTDILYRVQICANSIEHRDYAEEEIYKLSKIQLTTEQKTKLGTTQDYLGACLMLINNQWKVQVGSFINVDNARVLKEVLVEIGYSDAGIIKFDKNTQENTWFE
jgi:hypothetical protein